jgi:hypothetical protein
MPRQVEEQPRTININIELQDRRANANAQMTYANANSLSVGQHSNTSAPAAQSNNTTAAVSRANGSPQNLPVFAPPPSHAAKGSHFSYDNMSRSSSPVSTPDMKGKKQKKHRKVCDIMALLPFGKPKQQQQSEEKKKKKKKGLCFWGCCCCLSFLVLLAILIPLMTLQP